MSPTLSQIGMRLKKLRAQRGLTQTALASQAGISREYVRKLEAGLSDPTVGLLDRIAKVLSVPVAAFTHPGRLWLCEHCGRALYLTATRAVPPHHLGVRLTDNPLQLMCANCGAIIALRSEPPGGTNVLPIRGVVVL